MITPKVRWMMLKADIPSVLLIDKTSFLRKWNEDMYASMLKKRDHHGLVATCQGIVVGFMLVHTKSDSIELIRMGVHPEFRNKRAGFAMICRIKSWLTNSKGKRTRISTMISEYNDSAHCWLRRQGFLATKVHKVESGDYYQFEYWLDENEIENNAKFLASSQ